MGVGVIDVIAAAADCVGVVACVDGADVVACAAGVVMGEAPDCAGAVVVGVSTVGDG